MVRETWVQSQVASYKRLLKRYLIPPCLTLSNIRYVSRVRWSDSGKGVASSSTPRCSSYWKGGLLVALDNGRQLYLLYLVHPYSSIDTTTSRKKLRFILSVRSDFHMTERVLLDFSGIFFQFIVTFLFLATHPRSHFYDNQNSGDERQ